MPEFIVLAIMTIVLAFAIVACVAILDEERTARRMRRCKVWLGRR